MNLTPAQRLKVIQEWLNRFRDEKDFDALKKVRNQCRVLIAVSNKDWFTGDKS